MIFDSEKDKVIQAIEEDERYWNFLAYVSEGNDTEVEQKMQYWKTELQAKPEADKGQMKVLECGIRWAVEARRKEWGDEQEQRRQGEQEQRRQGEQEQRRQGRARATAAWRTSAELRTGAKQASKASKCVSATKNSSRRRERRAQSSRRQRMDWQRYGQAEEVQASSEGEMRGVERTRPAGKAKEKGTEEKENT